jgi:TPR repeat protein
MQSNTDSLRTCSNSSSESNDALDAVEPTELLTGLAKYLVKIGDKKSAAECAWEAYRLDKRYAVLVADFLCTGVISQKGDKNSLYYYRKAHRYGEVFAAYRIGRCYFHGYGTAINYEKAYKYFAIGHANGDYDATVNLGFCFEKGHGVRANIEIAYELYCEAVKAENRSAVYALSRMICQGKLINIDQYDAFTVLRNAYWGGLIRRDDVELNRIKNLISVESYETHVMLNSPSMYLRLNTSSTLVKHFKSKLYFIDNIIRAFDFYEVSIGPVVDTINFMEIAVEKLTHLENGDTKRLKFRGA